MPLGFLARFMQNCRVARACGRFDQKQDGDRAQIRHPNAWVWRERASRPQIATSYAVLHKSRKETKWHWASACGGLQPTVPCLRRPQKRTKVRCRLKPAPPTATLDDQHAVAVRVEAVALLPPRDDRPRGEMRFRRTRRPAAAGWCAADGSSSASPRRAGTGSRDK